MSTKDQFGDPIPDDLVTIPSIQDLTDEDIGLIGSVDWYEVITGESKILAVSAKAIDFLSEDAISEYGDIDSIDKIGQGLHRFSIEDSFYHA